MFRRRSRPCRALGILLVLASATGSCGGIHSCWLENRASFAFEVLRGAGIVTAWTSRSLCKLSTQCSGVIKVSARDALSRIKRGYPPRAKMSWPLLATAFEVVRMASDSTCEGDNSVFEEVA